ncbi:hypothetical protein BDR26DRAFT_863732 [Obelidium mucronatum]|nr:hypothetical protein BDR26DRAFT_863732 [Obelidium mucronatum]
MVKAEISKGERIASLLLSPKVERCVPESLTAKTTLGFDPNEIDLISPVLNLLDIPHEPTLTAEHKSRILRQINPPILGSQDLYFNIRFRTALQQRVKDSHALGESYETLIKTVVAPHLYNSLTVSEKLELTDLHSSNNLTRIFQIKYQYPPSLRIHPAHSPLFKRTHRDLEYGHQPGEINFWLPLTDTQDPNTATMDIETQVSSDGEAFPYTPIRLPVGLIQRFHGSLLHHKVDPNQTPWTRVSLDFRIAIVKCWDPQWRIPGLKIVHGMKDFDLVCTNS